MSDIKPLPVTETPAAPAVDSTPVITDATAAPELPKVTETKPLDTAAITEAPAASTETPVEASAEETKTVEPKESGHILYHAPGNFLKEFLPIPPKKVFFWFGEDPVESAQLKAYLAKGKEAATSTAAWASQTGKGLLFFNKHGEDKTAPSGALNLADAEDIKPVGTGEFTFRLHGHKHKFDAQTTTERDSWVVGIKKFAEEAKLKKEEIVNSEGYKEALAKLKPSPVAAVAAPKVSHETPKKSVEVPAEESAVTDEVKESKKVSKSRSRSRGPLSFLNKKKEEAKEKSDTEEKKDEAAVPETTSTDAAPVTATTDAPIITDAIAPVEDKKAESIEESKEEPKKENKRLSRFESFFKGTGKKEHKKDDTVVPTTEEPISAEAPKIEDPAAPVVTEPVSAPAPIITDAPKEDVKSEETSPAKDNRKSSFLGGLKGFTQKVRSPSSEHPPVSESSKIDETPATTEPIVAPVAATEPATDAVATEPVDAETSKTEKRRSSFFGFGTVKKGDKKDTGAVDDSVKTDVDEPAPVTEDVAPEVPKKSVDEKVEPASPKEHKESPIASITRRVSKAFRSDKPRKETKSAAAATESKDESKVDESAEAAPVDTLPEPIALDESKPVGAIGDVVPEAVTVGSAPAHQSTPTVAATA
jgi:hypothetical protein